MGLNIFNRQIIIWIFWNCSWKFSRNNKQYIQEITNINSWIYTIWSTLVDQMWSVESKKLIFTNNRFSLSLNFLVIWTCPWKFLKSLGFINHLKNLFFKFDKSRILLKNRIFFPEKTIFWREHHRYGLQIFSREYSDYLQHSVLSPKRFGQLETKLEQKGRPPGPGVRGVPQRT